jgi:uncharacterized protein
MKKRQNQIDRRNFLKTAGVAGLGTALVSTEVLAGSNDPNTPKTPPKPKLPQVAKRKLGKTGVEVPCLSLGVMFNAIDNQIVLKKSLEWGINYWDTANMYANGNSELGIGKFLKKHPEVRKDLFIVSKASRAKDIEQVEDRLQTSLKRMNTKYIDMYYSPHAMSDPVHLNDDLRKWVEDAKKRKLIRFFGFSTHKNMAACLAAASKLNWIDGIMTSYNFRLMQDKKMLAAVEACHKKGIALIAMKTQAKEVETEESKKLIQHFSSKGFTPGQAKIKVVLQDERFCCACVGMKSIAILTENAAAVVDKSKLDIKDTKVLEQHSRQTCSGYCAGCADICDSVLVGMPYTSDIMRYLMYHNSYGDRDGARELFAQIPGSVRAGLLGIDYSVAEARCPQRLPIAKLIAEAVSCLA